jgi:hypothetical protein
MKDETEKYEGIIGIIETNNKNIIFISGNDEGKYNGKVSEEFIKLLDIT